LKKQINKKRIKKQIEIKRIMTKLDVKNKLKNTFVFYQIEEREKKREEKCP
jgi:hypothetical protein